MLPFKKFASYLRNYFLWKIFLNQQDPLLKMNKFIIVLGVTCFLLFGFKSQNQSSLTTAKVQIINKTKASIKQIYFYDSEGNEKPILAQKIEAGKALEIQIDCGVYTVSVESTEGSFCDYYNFDVCQQSTWELTECEEK